MPIALAERAQPSTEFAGAPLVITAGTYYTDRKSPRFEQSLVFTENAIAAGVPVVIVDNSPLDRYSHSWVTEAHSSRGATVVRANIGGIATQRQQGVAHAMRMGAEKVVGTEAEKPLIPAFASELSTALNDSDVLVVGRTQTAEDSLPPVQQRTERLAGWILRQTRGLPHDALAGPRGFTRDGAAVLAAYPSHRTGMNNWLYLYETVFTARDQGLRVDGINLDFTYPESLVAEETGDDAFDQKRLDQFAMQLGHLMRPVAYNPNVTDRIQTIAAHTFEAVSQFDSTLPLAKQFEQFDQLERVMVDHGYQPAARLQEDR